MTPEQEKALARARARLRAKQAIAAKQTNVVEQAGDGINEGLSSTLGLPVDAVTMGLNSASGAINNLFGVNIPAIENPAGGSDQIQGLMSRLGFISGKEPQTTTQSLVRKIGQDFGAGAPFLPVSGPASLARTMPGLLGGAVGSGSARELASQVAPDSQAAEIVAGLAGGIGGGLMAGTLASNRATSAARKSYVADAQSSEDLSNQAKKLYQEGHSLGLKIKPNATKGFSDRLRSIAADEGMITPSGEVAENANLKQLLKLLDDYQAGSVSTKQMQTVRKRISALAGSPEPDISRMGVKMKGLYDDFLGQFAPQFRQANELNRRAMLGDMMDRHEELADIRAAQFTQSGDDNALRTEFAQLDRSITKGKTKGLRPDQIEAVKTVSRGNAPINVARAIGRFAPKGPISSGVHSVPFFIGNSIGGPQVGAAFAGGTMATGVAGDAVATALRRRAADLASASMRSSMPFKPLKSRDSMRGLLALLMGQGATGVSQN